MIRHFREIEEINMSKARRRGRKKKNKFSFELLGIILVFISILSIGEFGFVGQFIANTLRIFVGETFQLLGVLLGLLGIFYLFNGKNPKIKGHRFIGSLLL